MKKSPHVIWVCPSSRLFFRSKGEVRCRPGSIIPKLAEHGIKVNVLIPNDPTLLPKTKLSPARSTRHVIHLSQDYPVDIIKLTRGSVSPGIYMVSMPSAEPAIATALFNKAAMALAQQLKRPVDIFHLFDWGSSLLPLFLEMEKNGNRLYKTTHTFLSVNSLREQGSFAPSIMNYLGIPKTLFHPEGVEFYGRVSFLKAGLLFSDSVGLVENGTPIKHISNRNGHGLEGVLDAQSHKLRRWASDRSLRSHLDAYEELLTMPPAAPILPRLVQKVHGNNDQLKKFIESWGPPPPDRYNTNTLSFMIQSPTKAFAFWEWTHHQDFVDYGVALEDHTHHSKRTLSRGLQSFGDYWIEVKPASEYVVELIGYRKDGSSQPLLRSRPIRTPRVTPSPNVDAIFIDVRDRKRSTRSARDRWAKFIPGGTSAFEWSSLELAMSQKEPVSS